METPIEEFDRLTGLLDGLRQDEQYLMALFRMSEADEYRKLSQMVRDMIADCLDDLLVGEAT